MNRTLTALGALTAGAAALYLTDPEHGRRRRAAIRRQLTVAARDAGETVEDAGRQALEGLQALGQDAQQAGRQAADRLETLADEGRHAGRRAWHRAAALAQEGRERLSARRDGGSPAPERPGAGRPVLRAAGGIAVGAAAMLLFTLQRRAPDDATLEQRVRAALRRTMSHPEALQVTASSGCVSLGGAVLAEDLARLFECVAAVRGVRKVQEAGLQVHGSADEVPALQGGALRGATDAGFAPVSGASAPQLAALAGGAALLLYGSSRRGLPGLVAATAGLGLAARAARRQGASARLSGSRMAGP